jgi:peptidoglycan/xylan/chitin deacetylase (PgdA/CDA1 family)
MVVNGQMVRAFPWARIPFSLALGGALVAAALAAAGRAPSPGWLIVLCVILLTTIGLGVFWMPSGLFARPILSGARGGAELALTFDDGPDPDHTPKVLDVLERHGHRATFFVIGNRAAAHPALLEDIVRRGHSLGNHSYAHARATATFGVPRLVADLERAQATLAAAQGRAPRWFRPPAGVLSPRVTAAAQKTGLELVGWTATARDGIRTSVEAAYRRLERAARPGAILVLHDAAERRDRAPIAVEVLDRLCGTLAARGLRSVTLDELLADEAPRSRRS